MAISPHGSTGPINTAQVEFLIKEEEALKAKRHNKHAYPSGYVEHLAKHRTPNMTGHPGHFHLEYHLT